MSAAFPALPGFRIAASEEVREGGARVPHPDAGLRVTFAPETPMPAGWYQLELQFPPEGLVDVVARFSFAGDRVLWLRLPVLARNHFVAQFRLEDALTGLMLVVSGSGRIAEPATSRFERVGLTGQLTTAAKRGVEVFRRDGLGVFRSAINYVWRLTRPGSIAISRGSTAEAGERPYDAWIRVFDEAPERDRARHEARLAGLAKRPLISILALARRANVEHLVRLAAQIYPAWELLIDAPKLAHEELRAALIQRGVGADKIVLADSGAADMAARLNALLASARGDYVLPLVEGAILRPHALLEFAMTLELAPGAQLVYADEDEMAGTRDRWRFKPAWSPHLLAAQDYVGNPVLLRRDTVQALGGWLGPQHELLKRLAQTDARVVHLAKLLAHAPALKTATAARTPATVPNPAPRVSLIIPTRDAADILATCIRSIRTLTMYPDYEILIIDNGSVEEPTKKLFAELSANPAIRILPRPEPFNYSRLNNAAAREATGKIIGLVNNDIEVTHGEWLTEMVTLAMEPQTGCVGAKLLYPDRRIQHAGVVIGLGGVAGHAHRLAAADAPGYLDKLRSAHEVSAVTAACVVIRRAVYDQVNGLDEELKVAFNDVDFCLRVREAGYVNLWTPFAELIHHESVSRGRDLTPAKARRFHDEYEAMQRRWGATLLQDPYYSPHLTYDREDSSLRLR